MLSAPTAPHPPIVPTGIWITDYKRPLWEREVLALERRAAAARDVTPAELCSAFPRRSPSSSGAPSAPGRA